MSTASSSGVSLHEMADISSRGVVKSWGRTVPELLATRQNLGCGPRQKRRVDVNILASRAAWNPSRLQNMILAVGPGTPASKLPHAQPLAIYSSDSESSDSSASAASEIPTAVQEAHRLSSENEDEDDDEDRQEQSRPTARSRWLRRSTEEDEEEDDDQDDSEGDEGSAEDTHGMHCEDAPDDEEDDEEEDQCSESESQSQTKPYAPVPSMRHGGCINTAAWLDCGWRLSTAGSSCDSQVTEECPTQLITSGDDHLVKFWDVSQAMGMTSPLAGGRNTHPPFASVPKYNSSNKSVVQAWKAHDKQSHQAPSGSAIPLCTLHTGHRGNVFHVTPVVGQPGKVVTCGADGFLRMTDMESGAASIVVSPEYDDDVDGLLPAGLLSLRSGMCFSHHFLNAQVGLLCSERGLRRFDLRLPAREQPSQSILGGPLRACKSCAVWSNPSSQLEEGDSSYVFAAGSSADVALCDLRMGEGSNSRVIQHYRPTGLSSADNVSVSGLDLSRDKQELLVSYESDQIYTFPVFSQITSKAGPTVDQIRDLCNEAEDEHKVLTELAAYGGHLNRFTFLKNAKYAGPRDEYICTGSDSGHAWIYEKATGSVVSFLTADHSTCNGVIPHPSLPIFITYGIDSTAKLWRATDPVDPEADDSSEGRRRCYRDVEYEISPVTRKWRDVQEVLNILDAEEIKHTDIMPDQIPNTRDIIRSGRLERFGHSIMMGSGVSQIGNDLQNLPDNLRQNLYACLRSFVDGDDAPVESDIEDLKHRISLIRLRHQADRLGLVWDPTVPWAFETRKHTKVGEEAKVKSGASNDAQVHPADLVPDHPSDWIPYDPDMCKSPWDFKNYFNTEDYADFYRENYLNSESVGSANDTRYTPRIDDEDASDDDAEEKEPVKSEGGIMSNDEKEDGSGEEGRSSSKMASSSEDDEEEEDSTMQYSYLCSVYNLLYETILLLKDGGNAALHAGDFQVAARRYDKAIQYGAVAFMSFPVCDLDFAKGRRETLKANGGYHLEWGSLLKTIIVSRLNLALLMLKPQFSHPEQAREQARLALQELKPFCAAKGKIMKGSKLDSVHRADEPEETFEEAMHLQTKAYFRLGSAYYEMGEYPEAVQSFEQSIESTKEANSAPDKLVLRRLSEAKRENKRHSKRQRKKFKLAIGVQESHRKKSDASEEQAT